MFRDLKKYRSGRVLADLERHTLTFAKVPDPDGGVVA